MLIECMTEGVFEITGLNVRDGLVIRDVSDNYFVLVIFVSNMFGRYYVATVNNLPDEATPARETVIYFYELIFCTICALTPPSFPTDLRTKQQR